jgi:hypothetical protein
MLSDLDYIIECAEVHIIRWMHVLCLKASPTSVIILVCHCHLIRIVTVAAKSIYHLYA